MKLSFWRSRFKSERPIACLGAFIDGVATIQVTDRFPPARSWGLWGRDDWPSDTICWPGWWHYRGFITDPGITERKAGDVCIVRLEQCFPVNMVWPAQRKSMYLCLRMQVQHLTVIPFMRFVRKLFGKGDAWYYLGSMNAKFNNLLTYEDLRGNFLDGIQKHYKEIKAKTIPAAAVRRQTFE